MDERDDLIEALKANVKEKERLLEEYRTDLRKHKSLVEWIVHTLESLLCVLKGK